MTNNVRIDQLHLRVPGLSRQQANHLGITVAQQLVREFPAITRSGKLSALHHAADHSDCHASDAPRFRYCRWNCKKDFMKQQQATPTNRLSVRPARAPAWRAQARTRAGGGEVKGTQPALSNHSLLRRPAGVLQTKLIIGKPNDQFEREADRVADQVMRMPGDTRDSETETFAPSDHSLQRKCSCGGTPGPTGECEECRKRKRLGLQTKLRINEPGDIYEQEVDRIADQVIATPAHQALNGAPPSIQRYTGQATGRANTAPAIVENVLASPGRPLDPALRRDMEQRFGHDFSRVRVHSGASAKQSALDVNAYAYTVGQNMVFGAGRYTPGTHDGRRLIAHELTHVVQQSRADGIRVGPRDEQRGLPPNSPSAQHQSDSTLGRQLLAHELTHVVQQPAVTAQTGRGLPQIVNRIDRTLQRQPAVAGRRQAQITVVFDEDYVEFYHRVIRAIQRSAGFRGVQVSFGQPFYDPILAIHRRLALAGTKTGSRVALRASALFDPEEFHEQITDGRVEIEQEARLRETRIAGVLTPHDPFAGRSLARLGLAEVADLSFTASPAATAADLGGLKWELYGGGGTLTPTASDDGTAVFRAGATPGPVSLDLVVASGLAAGRRVATLNLRAVAPDDAVMEQIPGSGVHHLKDHCGVGFCGRVFLRPVDVSFQNIQWSEGDGIGEAKGFYERLNGVPHCGSNNPCNVPMNILGGNSTTGCKVWMVDTVATSSDPPPFAWGYRLWPIDWRYPRRHRKLGPVHGRESAANDGCRWPRDDLEERIDTRVEECGGSDLVRGLFEGKDMSGPDMLRAGISVCKYADGTVIDLNFSDFSPSGSATPFRWDNGKIFPGDITPVSAPNLTAIKHAVDKWIDDYTVMFIAEVFTAAVFPTITGVHLRLGPAPASFPRTATSQRPAAAAPVRLGEPRSSGGGQAEPVAPIEPPLSETVKPSPSPPPARLPQSQIRSGVMIRTPVSKDPQAGPPEVLDVGAGRQNLNLGLPPERELVAVTRSDVPGAGQPVTLDATQPIPKNMQGGFTTLIINNPYGYRANIGQIRQALGPNGKIIVQGNWEANKYVRELGTSPVPPNMTRTIERKLPPSAILGEGFRTSSGDKPVQPNARITFEVTKPTRTYEPAVHR